MIVIKSEDDARLADAAALLTQSKKTVAPALQAVIGTKMCLTKNS